MKLRDFVPWKMDGSKTILPWGTEPFNRLQQELNRVFDGFLAGGTAQSLFSGGSCSMTFSPKVNVIESDEAITVTAELPGMEQNEIEVLLMNDSLVLRGERTRKEERADESIKYVESTYGLFERVIPLHNEIRSGDVDSKLRDGILTVILPKVVTSSKEVRKIEIRTDS